MTERSEQNAPTELGSKPLLACPFCGAAPKVKHIGNDYVKKQVCEIACTTFGCFAHQRVGILNGRGHTYDWAEQKCRERWNTRHANDVRQRQEGAVDKR